MKTKTVAIYCRTDIGGSPETRSAAMISQKNRLEQYAQSSNFYIYNYYEDNGISGHDKNRPGLSKMIQDYQVKKFETVLITHHNRLYRGNQWNEPKWPFPIISIDSSKK